MSLSLYELSVPVFTQSLTALAAILTKAEAHAVAKKIDATVFLNARLAPDMFALARQVQLASDFAKGGSARLAGVDVPKYDDNEVTFGDLQGRISKTLAFIASIEPERFIGAEARDIIVPMRGEQKTFNALAYFRHGALPNFFFHVTAAYLILRHNGVEVGKGDFIGAY